MRLDLRTFRMCVLGGSLAACVACGSDTTGPVSRTPAQQYWTLTLNHHAITLATVAPYNTIQLTATPRAIDGDTLPVDVKAVYTASDTSIVVDSTGFVSVHGTATKPNITVIAQLTVGGPHGITLADTAFVNVVKAASPAAVPALDSLIFRPLPGDSARRAIVPLSGTLRPQSFATPVAKKSDGTAIQNVVVRYYSSNPLIASFATPTTGQVTAVAPGVVLLTAEATVYGTSRIDSLWYTVGYPLAKQITYGDGMTFNGPAVPVVNALSTGNATISVGGVIVWANQIIGVPDDSLDVVFDDTTGIVGLTATTTVQSVVLPPDSGGNIPAFPAIQPTVYVVGVQTVLLWQSNAANERARVFPHQGTYHWSSQRQHVGGYIHVVSNDSLQ